ncbi:hypothetical protein K502DRAFT_362797 [Neoconidiobolus thromboides FSU 785]|nr:hypothetical protein K502DRAFT_362797 [Neoconidiobolus thromboides FSU 785]
MSSLTFQSNSNTIVNEDIPESKEFQEDFSSYQSLRLTQAIMGALYYLFFIFYELNFSTENSNMTLLFSLVSFIVALLLGDLHVAYKAMPSVYMSAQIFPGSLECISLAISVAWMVHSLTWLQCSVVLINTNLEASFLAIYITKFLTTISLLNWISWTFSFIF